MPTALRPSFIGMPKAGCAASLACLPRIDCRKSSILARGRRTDTGNEARRYFLQLRPWPARGSGSPELGQDRSEKAAGRAAQQAAWVLLYLFVVANKPLPPGQARWQQFQAAFSARQRQARLRSSMGCLSYQPPVRMGAIPMRHVLATAALMIASTATQAAMLGDLGSFPATVTDTRTGLAPGAHDDYYTFFVSEDTTAIVSFGLTTSSPEWFQPGAFSIELYEGQQPAGVPEIGRASCRERGEGEGGAGVWNERRQDNGVRGNVR